MDNGGIATLTFTDCDARERVAGGRTNREAVSANGLGCFVDGIHLMRLKMTFCGFAMLRQKSTANCPW